MTRPVLYRSMVSENHDAEGEWHTLWRCSGEQYHAFWQRLHHIEVGWQQMMQG